MCSRTAPGRRDEASRSRFPLASRAPNRGPAGGRRTGLLAGFILNRPHDLQESLHIVTGDAAADGLLELEQMTEHAPGDLTSRRGQRHNERPAISGADLARDEAPIRETIEDARQRRALVREAAMQLGDRRGRGRGQQRENVRLALREAEITQIGEIQADAVGRSMKGRNEAQGHRS
jgi:hypothetical protein